MPELLNNPNVLVKLRDTVRSNQIITPLVASELISPAIIVNDPANPVEVKNTPSTLIGTGQTRIVRSGLRTIASGASETLYTPTAGRVLFIKTLVLNNSSDGAKSIRVGDNISAAKGADTDSADDLELNVAAQTTFVVTMEIPMRIATALTCFSTGTGTDIRWFVSGWEQVE